LSHSFSSLAKILAGFEDLCHHDGDGIAAAPFVLPFFRDSNIDNNDNDTDNSIHITTITNTNTTMPPPEWDLLLGAAQQDRPDELRRLVRDVGVDASHANGVGQSALHIAALWGHVASVQVLCNNDLKANVNATNRLSGATPLHMVVQSRKVKDQARRLRIVQCLVDAGADVSVADDAGTLPVDYLVPLANTTSSSTSADDDDTVSQLRTLLQPQPPALWGALEAANVEQVQQHLLLLLLPASTTTVPAPVLPTYRQVTAVAYAVTLLLQNDNDDEYDNALKADLNEALARDMLALDPVASNPPDNNTHHHPKEALWTARLDCLEALLTAPHESVVGVASTTGNGDNDKKVYEEDTPLGQLLDALEQASYAKKGHAPLFRRRLWIRAAQRLQATPTYALSEDYLGHLWRRAARGARSSNHRGQNVAVTRLLWEAGLAGPLLGANRQGMTVLHFAARSGQTPVVEYLLTLPGAAALVAATDDRGRTARAAAASNEHGLVLTLLDVFEKGPLLVL
jgi:ankyrin repeat protein